MNSKKQSFWAITSYFNPCGYKRKLNNYQIFRKFLKIPLVTVELSFNNQFELREDDADILVQIKGNENNIMWQKERLLNIALTHLPKECDKVAWLDCDIVFGDNNWVEKASILLEKYQLIHLFKKVIYLEKDAEINFQKEVEINSKYYHSFKISSIYNHLADEPIFYPSLSIHGGVSTNGNPGMAWASHKELLLKHNLYDGLIVGGADKLFNCAAIGNFDFSKNKIRNDALYIISSNNLQMNHYLPWAKSFYSSIQGNIYFLDMEIFHLWHGDRNNRHYRQRQEIIKKFNFAPDTDISLDDNNCWKWNSNKPELHKYLRDYFYSRKEDE